LFRRDKQAIEEWSTDNVALCEARQQRIVADVIQSLKPGGFLVYSTCTFNTRENEENVRWMMNEWNLMSVNIPIPNNWPVSSSLDETLTAYRFLPHQVTGEGLFMACLQKPADEQPAKGRPYKRKDKISKQQLDSVRTWLANADDFEIVMVGERVHAIPVSLTESFQQLTHHLYLKNAGVFMGTFAKNELIPSHHLALSNTLSQSIQRLEVTKEEAIKYLRKDNLVLDTPLRGWTVVTYQHLPLGWVKVLPNRLNNYLPSHLRILKEYTHATQTEKI
jgi:NOL1/NOP2/fmu family ribosome biogenesis protein